MVQVVGEHAFECLHGRRIEPREHRCMPINDGALGVVQHVLAERLMAKARSVARKDFGGSHRRSSKPADGFSRP
jgi:hypothetical protein